MSSFTCSNKCFHFFPKRSFNLIIFCTQFILVNCQKQNKLVFFRLCPMLMNFLFFLGLFWISFTILVFFKTLILRQNLRLNNIFLFVYIILNLIYFTRRLIFFALINYVLRIHWILLFFLNYILSLWADLNIETQFFWGFNDIHLMLFHRILMYRWPIFKT
jgi:hypothetical protein